MENEKKIVAIILILIMMFSMSAFADLESAYLCRGFVWDTHLLSSQYADGTMDLGPFGRISAYAWSMLSKSPASHADGQSCRFSEIDYGLRYAYDLALAEDWTLTLGVIGDTAATLPEVGDITFTYGGHKWKVNGVTYTGAYNDKKKFSIVAERWTNFPAQS